MDIDLPAFKYISSGDGQGYRIEFRDPPGGYTLKEAVSITRRLNALVECDAAIRDDLLLGGAIKREPC